jgi:hypothetical protein
MDLTERKRLQYPLPFLPLSMIRGLKRTWINVAIVAENGGSRPS